MLLILVIQYIVVDVNQDNARLEPAILRIGGDNWWSHERTNSSLHRTSRHNN